MVFGVVTSDGDAKYPYNFSNRLKINTEIYIKFILEVVPP